MRTDVLLGLATLHILACGSGSSSPPPQDAGVDASGGDDGSDGGGSSCPPICVDAGHGNRDAADDASMSCDQLKASYEMLRAAATACNPQLPMQCTAATNDPCCPITVTSSNNQAVDDFDQAVMTYQAQCTADCSLEICQTAPSNECDPFPNAPTQGQCK